MVTMNDGRITMWAATEWMMELKRANDDYAECTHSGGFRQEKDQPGDDDGELIEESSESTSEKQSSVMSLRQEESAVSEEEENLTMREKVAEAVLLIR
jgi:hypothetical protein